MAIYHEHCNPSLICCLDSQWQSARSVLCMSTQLAANLSSGPLLLLQLPSMTLWLVHLCQRSEKEMKKEKQT